MSRWYLPTLRSRVRAVAVVAVLPYLLFIAAIAIQWRSHEFADTEHTSLSLARQVAATHKRRVDRSTSFMRAVAPIALNLPDGGLRAETVPAFVSTDGAEEPNLAVFDGEGRLLAGSHPRLADGSKRPCFERAIRSRQVAVDDYHLDAATKSVISVLAYPVVDDPSRARRVLMMLIDLDWLRDVAAEPLLPTGSTIVVFDARGTIVAEQPGPGSWIGRSGTGHPVVQAAMQAAGEGTLRAAGLDGVERIFAFRGFGNSIAGESLYVAVGLPTSTATAQVDGMLRGDVAALGLVIALALVLASAGNRRFVLAPVRALVHAAEQLGRGDMRARVGRCEGPAELAQLAAAFDRMAEGLEVRSRESAEHRARIALEEHRFQSLIENSEEGILLRDPSGRIVYASPSTERLLGYVAVDLLGRTITDLVHPEDRAQLISHVEQVIRSPRVPVSLELRVRRADGEWRWLECSMRNLLDDAVVGAIVTNYRDVTTRREAQEQLRAARNELEARVRQRTAELVKANESLRIEVLERHRAQQAALDSEVRFRLLLDSAAEGIVGLDVRGRCTFCNPAALRLLGFADDRGLLGKTLHQVIHSTRPDGTPYPEDDCAARAALRTLDGTHVDTEVFWRADGTSFPVEYWSHPLRLDGRIVGLVLSFFDISERRRSQETLQKLSRAIEQTADSVFVTSRQGVIEYVNPAFEQLTGYTRAEAIGATPKLVNSGTHDPDYFNRLWRTILSGEVFRNIVTNRTKDGVLFDEDQTITPIRDATGAITHFVSTGRDITARKRTEQAVRRLNTMLEQETTRIANLLHDEAGQFLTSAHLVIADVARDLPPGPRERLQAVRRSLDQVEEQLRTVSHQLHPRILQDLGLAETLRIQSTAFSRRTGVRVSVDAPHEFRCPATVEVILYRLVQEALNNIARHAQAHAATIALAAEDHAVSCTVRDDGKGFDTESAFGNGGAPSLGLRGMRDRVEAIGGTLEIVSAPGRGTEVRAVITVEAMYAGADTAGR